MAVSFKDTFNGASSATNLGSWTPTDVGSTWTIGAGAANTWVVQTNGNLKWNESVNANGSNYYAYDDSSHAGGYVEFVTPSSLGVNSHNIVALRLVDANNWVGITMAGTGSAGFRVITCVSGTVDDTHYQGQGAVSTTYRIEDDGTDIRFYFGGTLVHTLTNYTAVSASETKKGLVIDDNGSTNVESITSYESGTLAAGNTITLTDIDNYRVIPRNGSGQASLTVSGSYTGTPTNIEYRIVNDGTDTAITGHNWSTLETGPTGGTFSGTVTAIPEGGWYNVDVRFSNDTGTTDGGTNKWGVGYHIGIGGQSHAEDLDTNGTGTPNARLAEYTGTAWQVHPTTGVGQIELGNDVITGLGGSIPVAIYNGAVGGSALRQEADGGSGYWEAGAASLDTGWNTDVDEMGANPHFGLFWQGDRDAISGVVTEAEYESSLTTAIAQYRTDYGAGIPVIIGLLNRDNAAVDADWNAIRKAQLDVAQADANTYYFSVLDLAVLADGQHLTDASLTTAGDRIANIVNFVNGDSTYWRGPFCASFTVLSATTGRVTITHSGGSDFTPTAASAITGFEVSDDASTWETATASRASATTIDLSWTSSFSGDVYVRYQYGGNPNKTGAVVDNATVALPLEPTASNLTATLVTGTGSLSGQSSSISASGTLTRSATGSLSAQTSAVTGTGTVGNVVTGTGTLAAQAVSVSGAGEITHTGTGVLTAQSSLLSGVGTVAGAKIGIGSLVSNVSIVAGAGTLVRSGTGALASQASQISGVGVLPSTITGTGALVCGSSSISGADLPPIWTEVPEVTTIWTEIA